MKRIPTYAFIVLAVLLTALLFSACPTDDLGGDDDPILITIANDTQWNDAISKIQNGGNGKDYVLTINGAIQVSPVILGTDPATFSGADDITVTLKGESGTLSPNGDGTLISLWGYSALRQQRLIIDGPTLAGKADNDGPVVYVGQYTALEMKKGSITGNTRIDGRGGGVMVYKGSFTMSGGTISNNTATDDGGDGGGVALQDSTFTMSGGTISGNTATNGVLAGGYGGGVFVDSASSFYKSGGGIISNNTASVSGGGDAVYYEKDSGYYRSTALGTGDDISTAYTNIGWGQ
jgi:hypothetical protein